MENALTPQDFYDSVVNSIEAGQHESAMPRFVGVLDTLAATGADLRMWRQALQAHRLGELLGCRADEASEKTTISAATLLPISQIEQACATRTQVAANAIQSAINQGRKIIALDAASHASTGTAKSIVALHQPSELSALAQNHTRYDLIAALQFVSRCQPEALAAGLSQLASILAPGGRILLSSFLHFHVGSGWRVLRSGDELHMHNEASLTAAAEEAGLELSTFRESHNTLLWAVAQRRDFSNDFEEDTP